MRTNMERIDTKPPHGEQIYIAKDQFLMLMYDIAETMLFMDDKHEPEWYVDEAEEILIRNGILKGE